MTRRAQPAARARGREQGAARWQRGRAGSADARRRRRRRHRSPPTARPRSPTCSCGRAAARARGTRHPAVSASTGQPSIRRGARSRRAASGAPSARSASILSRKRWRGSPRKSFATTSTAATGTGTAPASTGSRRMGPLGARNGATGRSVRSCCLTSGAGESSTATTLRLALRTSALRSSTGRRSATRRCTTSSRNRAALSTLALQASLRVPGACLTRACACASARGKTTFGTDKKWYQRKPTEAGPGPAGVRPPQTRIKGGRFNRHRSLTFIEQAQRLGGTLPGPGLYNPQDAGIYAVPGGRFNVSKPMTHWQLIEKDGATSLCLPFPQLSHSRCLVRPGKPGRCSSVCAPQSCRRPIVSAVLTRCECGTLQHAQNQAGPIPLAIRHGVRTTIRSCRARVDPCHKAAGASEVALRWCCGAGVVVQCCARADARRVMWLTVRVACGRAESSTRRRSRASRSYMHRACISFARQNVKLSCKIPVQARTTPHDDKRRVISGTVETLIVDFGEISPH